MTFFVVMLGCLLALAIFAWAGTLVRVRFGTRLTVSTVNHFYIVALVLPVAAWLCAVVLAYVAGWGLVPTIAIAWLGLNTAYVAVLATRAVYLERYGCRRAGDHPGRNAVL